MAISPWTDHRARIDGSAFEKLVLRLVTEAGQLLPSFRIQHQDRVVAPDGEYRIDITARFRQLDVEFLILVECKDHSRAVEREEVQILSDKIRAVGAQKGMLFSTNGFQKGAVEYARVHGIALIRIIDEELVYLTRSSGLPGDIATQSSLQLTRPPRPSAFCGQMISHADSNFRIATIRPGRVEPIICYLRSG